MMKRFLAIATFVACVVALTVTAPSAGAGPELVANPSFESVGGANPVSWQQNQWGGTVATFSVPSSGARSGQRFARVDVTSSGSGDAKWMFNRVPLTPATTYDFSSWYRSTVTTELVAEYQTGGGLVYQYLGDVPPSAGWARATATVVPPAGTTAGRVFHLIGGVGRLDLDDISLSNSSDPAPTPTATATPTTPTTTPAPSPTPTATPTPTTPAPTATPTTPAATATPTPTATPTATPTTPEPTATATPTTPAPSTTPTPTTPEPTATPTPTTPAPPSGGLLANPSVEAQAAGQPVGWSANSWGSIGASFSVPTGDAHSGDRHVRVVVDSRSSGDAKWFPAPVPVSAGTTYTWSNWYRSNVTSELTVRFSTPSGFVYQWLGSVAPSSDWSRAERTFIVPQGTTDATVFHLIFTPGFLDLDDASLAGPGGATPTPTPTTPTPTSTSTPEATATPSPTPTTPVPTPTATTTAAPTSTPEATPEATPTPIPTPTTPAATPTPTPTTPAATATPTTPAATPTPTTPPTEGLVPNGSLEAGGPDNADGWSANSWGATTATFSLPSSGGHTGSRFARLDVTARSSGDAKWSFSPLPVTAGTTYRFTSWYRATASSQLVIAWSTPSGFIYQWLGDVAPAQSWTRTTTTALAPAGAQSATVFHLLAAVGRLDIDDVAFAAESGGGPPTTTPLVSLTFDDGWTTHATVAGPALDAYGYDGTFYITSGFLDEGPYMSTGQLLGLHGAGHEIGAHTVSHPFLTSLSFGDVEFQIRQSQSELESLIGEPVRNMATPYGDFNGTVLGQIMSVYGSHRTVFAGLNGYGTTDAANLRVRNVLNTTTPAEVDAWLDEAERQGAWLILVYHQLVDAPSTYDTTPGELAAHLSSISSRGLDVVTVAEGLAAVGAG